MGAVKDKHVWCCLKNKSKKRKKKERNALGEHGNVQSSNEGQKKKKTKILGNMNASEVVADVDSNSGACDGSKKENKDIIKNSLNKKNEANNSKKVKKKKKNKVGVERGASQAEVASEKIEPMEDSKGKKNKKKKTRDSGADYAKDGYLHCVDLHSISNGECSGITGHKRKKKSLSSTTGGTIFGVPETNKEKVVDCGTFVENQIGGRITQKINSVKDKKRKKKKKDSLGAGSLDGEHVNDTNLLSARNGESSRDRASKRKQGNFMGSHIQGDIDAIALKTNKRNNPVEPSERCTLSKKLKKVRFSDRVEFLSLADNSKGTEKLKDHSKGKKKVGLRRCKRVSKEEDPTVSNLVVDNEENNHTQKGDDGLIQGRRFSKEEDEIIERSVLNYIEKHQLGYKGLEMVLKCGYYPEVRDCWREIGEALPSRPHVSVYRRAHVLFERSESRSWTPEEIELVKNFHKKYGPDWKTLAEELGKHRVHVKDTWHRIRYPNINKGSWSQDEYQALFDLVNMDLRMKAFEEKKSKHGMLRDNISWEAVSKRLSTRSNALCCQKWYDQLTSPMVAEGKWADTDDYRLIIALDELDAACQEDVNWDNLLEHRSGDVCRKRWNQMVRNIGEHGTKSFAEQVEILSKRYCPDLLDTRVAYDSKPAVD